jgi:hypothetical protein
MLQFTATSFFQIEGDKSAIHRDNFAARRGGALIQFEELE